MFILFIKIVRRITIMDHILIKTAFLQGIYLLMMVINLYLVIFIIAILIVICIDLSIVTFLI